MPVLIKPRTLGLLTKVERQPPGASLIVSAFAIFDLAQPNPYRLEGEQGMWLLTAKELPPGAIFDISMPKPCAEILVGGHAAAPYGQPVQRMGIAWAIGPVKKQLLVTGDRYWRVAQGGCVPTEPQPFLQMPLTPQRAFGGEGYTANPEGTGYLARKRVMAGEAVALPNIEIPEEAVRTIQDTPRPPRYGPMPVDSKERLQYAGTYDENWLKTRAPALAADVDPRLFLFAPPDQRLPGFLNGDEPYGLRNFAADAPEISARLPGFRVRCFIGWTDPRKPVAELLTRIDTLWLFAGARRGVLTYRTAVAVEDIEGNDVADIMVAYERMDHEPRPSAHYLEVRQLRLDPQQASKYAFAEHQLTPQLPQSELDRRAAKRRAIAEERRQRQRETMQWVVTQELTKSGLPKELHPAIEIPEPEDIDLPMPLPEEIESGEVDLAGLLDALDALMAKKMAEVDQLRADAQPSLAAMQDVAAGTADPGAIDRLLATLGQAEVVDKIDAELKALPSGADMQPAGADRAASAEIDAVLKRAHEWRQELLSAATPPVDEQAQFALARARFLALPEGRPLEDLRRQLADDRIVFPELPAFDEPPQAASAAPSDIAETLDDALRALEESPFAPPGAAQQVKDALAGANAQLAKALPGLAADGRAPLSTLMAGSKNPSTGSVTEVISSAEAQSKETLGKARDQVDAAEAQMIAGMAQARLASPQPLQPDKPLTPAVARSLGDLVAQQFRAGVILAGRDLAGADLANVDLSGADLSGAFLERARLDGARLVGANLSKATLCGASLVGTDLSRCDLSSANLSSVNGERALFVGSRLVETSVLEAKLPQACFDGAELRQMTLMLSPLTGASFRNAQVSDLIFMQTDLAGSDWQAAKLQRIHFMDLSLDRVNVAGGHLHEVCFIKVLAAQSDFSGTSLSTVLFAGGVNLSGVRFSGSFGLNVTFQESNLVDADFSASRFDGACFVGSSLSRAAFRRASLKRALLSRNDLQGGDYFAANLFEAQLNRADLTGASLRAANLYGADLMDAHLVAADFSGANLAKTIFTVPSNVG